MEFIFPAYLSVKDNVFTILGEITDAFGDYAEGKGYILKTKDLVYVFSKGKKKDSSVPYFWRNSTNELEFSTPNPAALTNFSQSKIVELNFDKIVNSTDPNEELYNEEALNDINGATSLFVPIINEDDDFLKRLIKQTIIDKGIDIKRLQHRLDKKYGLTNMKSALIGKTKMSVPQFIIWAELLGISWTIIIADNKTDNQTPLSSTLVYNSRTDSIRHEKG